MFLSKVYKHSKWLFIVMILFSIGQLFINFKRGMVFSPFYHYGMYSQVIKVENNYGVFELEVNGKQVQASSFTPQQWDKIILPLTYFSSLNTKSNSLYNTDINRLMNKIHIAANQKKYLQNCDVNGFENWYLSYLQTILKEKIKTLHIQYHIYQFISGRLQPTNSVLSLSRLCS